jgi:hypothetical protein
MLPIFLETFQDIRRRQRLLRNLTDGLSMPLPRPGWNPISRPGRSRHPKAKQENKPGREETF